MIQPNDVRLFLKDRPEYNRLLGHEEFTQEQIDQAMKITVMAFNEMSPSSTYTVENFPYKYLLLTGTVAHLLLSGGISRTRNRLTYQTDGVSIDDESSADVELQLANNLKQEFLGMAKGKKIEINVKNGWGKVYSEYMYTNIYRTSRGENV